MPDKPDPTSRIHQPRRPIRGTREALLVVGLVAVALLSVWLALRSTIAGTAGDVPDRAASLPDPAELPNRIPYADLISGKVRDLPNGKVEIFYDFNPKPKIEGRIFTEDDLVPQLGDWNLRLPGSPYKTSLIRGEWRLRGQGRTRLSFLGPVSVSAELEIVSDKAAIQLSTNRKNEGYECEIAPNGVVRIWRRVLVKTDDEESEAGDGSTEDKRGLGKSNLVLGEGVVTVVFARSDTELWLTVDGKEVIRTFIGDDDPIKSGNIALRTKGKALWDNIRITGTVDPDWLKDRLFVSLSLLSRDNYEPDGSWTMARELITGSRTQSRTLFPLRDVDWISVPVPAGAAAVEFELKRPRFGVNPEIEVYESDGRTPAEGVTLTPIESGGIRARIAGAERTSVYVRIADPEGRRGTYDLVPLK